MANKKTSKHRRKTTTENAPAVSFSEEVHTGSAHAGMQFEAPASVANPAATAAVGAGTAYNGLSTQVAQPQFPVDTSSPLRLVPIYDLTHLPIDWTTGDRYIPRLDKSTAALQNVRLIPIYPDNQLANTSAQQLSMGGITAQDNIQRPNDIGGTAGSNPQPGAVSSSLQQNSNPSSTADVLELRGNTNTQVQFILPEGLPPMVPALGGVRRGPGAKIVLEGNEDAQICMVPRDSVEDSTLTSGEEITIKGNKKMQLFSGGGGGGGGGSSENLADGDTGQSDDTSGGIAKEESRHQAKASVQISDVESSQIMGFPSGGAAGSSSNISNIKQAQIMNVPQLAPIRPPPALPYATPNVPNVRPPGQPQAAPRVEAAGSWNFSEGFNNFSRKVNQFREKVWQANRTVKSFAESVNSRITLSKPTATDGFPRLLKRCVLTCAMSPEDKQDCVVDVYESRLRIRSISEDIPLQLELKYSDVKGITSNSPQHLELTDQENKVTSFFSEDSTEDLTDIASGIVSATYSVFPSVPFQSMFPIFKVSPEDRYDVVFGPYKNALQLQDESAGGSNVDPVLPDIRTFYLADFYRQFANGDLGLLRALKYNKWFTQFNADIQDVTPACAECIAEILEKNTTLEVIDFSQSKLKPLSIQKLALALSKNPSSKVVEIDFSNNTFSKKDVEALSAALAMPNRGFRRLILENTGITAKFANELLRGIHNNVCVTTLSCLSLSGLKFDLGSHFRRNNSIQSVGVLLGTPNNLQELNLSGGGMVLEEIVDSLADGCLKHLRLLELSGNYYRRAISKPARPKWKRFFTEAQSIDVIGFSNTRLSTNAFQAIIEGLSENKLIAEKSKGVRLDVSRNRLGLKGAQVLAEMAGQMRNIRSLDVTCNGLKNGLSLIFESYAADGGVNEILIGMNFTFLTQHKTFQKIGATIPRILEEDARKKNHAVEALIQMIKSEKSVVTSLDLTGSNLGAEMTRIINALKENRKITKLNVSGNSMGDDGATALADVLLSSTVIKSISFDRNNISISGLEKIAQVLWRNPSLKEVVMPSVDISTAHWEDHEKALELTGIFQLKTSSSRDLQTHVYGSLQKISTDSYEEAEYTEITRDTAVPSASSSDRENDITRVGSKGKGLKDPKGSVPIKKGESANVQSFSSKGNSTKTVAAVHVEGEHKSKELSTDNQVAGSRSETIAPVPPAKRWQRSVPSSRPDALQQSTKESVLSATFSGSSETRSVTSTELPDHRDSRLRDSGQEEQLITSADQQPITLPPLGTATTSSIALQDAQTTVSYQRKPAASNESQRVQTPEKLTQEVQSRESGSAPWPKLVNAQHKASASGTSSDEIQLKTEQDYANIQFMKKNESDNAQKDVILREMAIDVTSPKHVAELRSEDDTLQLGVDSELTYSAVHKAEPKKAPAKPSKPAKTPERQTPSGSAFTVSLRRHVSEDMAEENNSGSESTQKPTTDQDQTL